MVRCLIVDDSLQFLTAARGWLEREGIAVVGVASTVDQALQLAQELHPDVVLVDIDLGGESGFELASQLQRKASTFAPSRSPAPWGPASQSIQLLTGNKK